MPLLHHQPFKGVYIGSSYFQLLTLRIPFWMLRYLLRSWRPRRTWSLSRCISVELVRWITQLRFSVGGVGYTPNFKKLESGKDIDGVWIDPAPELVLGQLKQWADAAGIKSARIPGYWNAKPGATRSIGPRESEKVILYFHGGGYTALSAHPSLDVNENVTQILRHSSISRALSVEYRLTSIDGSCFPAAIIDALAAYKHVTTTEGYQPSNVIFAGDSAGGNLALSLCRYCVEYSKEFEILPPPPGALVLMSPWADLTASHAKGASSSPYANAASDFIGSPTPDAPVSPSARLYAGPHDLAILTHPYVSPSCLDNSTYDPSSFKGFPKTFVMYGDAEVLMDSIVTLVERMRKDMGEEKVEVHIAKDAFHDCVPFKFFEPERTEVARAAGRFIASL